MSATADARPTVHLDLSLPAEEVLSKGLLLALEDVELQANGTVTSANARSAAGMPIRAAVIGSWWFE